MKTTRFSSLLIFVVLWCATSSQAATNTIYQCQNPEVKDVFLDQTDCATACNSSYFRCANDNTTYLDQSSCLNSCSGAEGMCLEQFGEMTEWTCSLTGAKSLSKSSCESNCTRPAWKCPLDNPVVYYADQSSCTTACQGGGSGSCTYTEIELPIYQCAPNPAANSSNPALCAAQCSEATYTCPGSGQVYTGATAQNDCNGVCPNQVSGRCEPTTASVQKWECPTDTATPKTQHTSQMACEGAGGTGCQATVWTCEYDPPNGPPVYNTESACLDSCKTPGAGCQESQELPNGYNCFGFGGAYGFVNTHIPYGNDSSCGFNSGDYRCAKSMSTCSLAPLKGPFEESDCMSKQCTARCQFAGSRAGQNPADSLYYYKAYKPAVLYPELSQQYEQFFTARGSKEAARVMCEDWLAVNNLHALDGVCSSSGYAPDTTRCVNYSQSGRLHTAYATCPNSGKSFYYSASDLTVAKNTAFNGCRQTCDVFIHGSCSSSTVSEACVPVTVQEYSNTKCILPQDPALNGMTFNSGPTQQDDTAACEAACQGTVAEPCVEGSNPIACTLGTQRTYVGYICDSSGYMYGPSADPVTDAAACSAACNAGGPPSCVSTTEPVPCTDSLVVGYTGYLCDQTQQLTYLNQGAELDYNVCAANCRQGADQCIQANANNQCVPKQQQSVVECLNPAAIAFFVDKPTCQMNCPDTYYQCEIDLSTYITPENCGRLCAEKIPSTCTKIEQNLLEWNCPSDPEVTSFSQSECDSSCTMPGFICTTSGLPFETQAECQASCNGFIPGTCTVDETIVSSWECPVNAVAGQPDKTICDPLCSHTIHTCSTGGVYSGASGAEDCANGCQPRLDGVCTYSERTEWVCPSDSNVPQATFATKSACEGPGGSNCMENTGYSCEFDPPGGPPVYASEQLCQASCQIPGSCSSVQELPAGYNCFTNLPILYGESSPFVSFGTDSSCGVNSGNPMCSKLVYACSLDPSRGSFSLSQCTSQECQVHCKTAGNPTINGVTYYYAKAKKPKVLYPLSPPSATYNSSTAYEQLLTSTVSMNDALAMCEAWIAANNRHSMDGICTASGSTLDTDRCLSYSNTGSSHTYYATCSSSGNNIYRSATTIEGATTWINNVCASKCTAPINGSCNPVISSIPCVESQVYEGYTCGGDHVAGSPVDGQLFSGSGDPIQDEQACRANCFVTAPAICTESVENVECVENVLTTYNGVWCELEGVRQNPIYFTGATSKNADLALCESQCSTTLDPCEAGNIPAACTSAYVTQYSGYVCQEDFKVTNTGNQAADKQSCEESCFQAIKTGTCTQKQVSAADKCYDIQLETPECTAISTTSTDSFTCSTNNQAYDSEEQCLLACGTVSGNCELSSKPIACSTGEPIAGQVSCDVNGLQYPDMSACTTSCNTSMACVQGTGACPLGATRECVDVGIAANYQDTMPQETLLAYKNDGATDPDTQECLGDIYLFNGTPRSCKESGMQTGYNNCCKSDGDLVQNIQSQKSAIKQAGGYIKMAEAAVKVGGTMAVYAAETMAASGTIQAATVDSVINVVGSLGSWGTEAVAMGHTAAASGATASSAAMTSALSVFPWTAVAAIVASAAIDYFTQACEVGDMMTAALNSMGLCIQTDQVCSKTVPMLGCVQRENIYCCFDSVLAKVLHVEGRKQLSTLGELPSGPCQGFRPEEFALIDMSRVDLSEVYTEIQSKMTIPTQVQTNMQDAVQSGVQNLVQ